jgi:hypothetical protein
MRPPSVCANPTCPAGDAYDLLALRRGPHRVGLRLASPWGAQIRFPSSPALLETTLGRMEPYWSAAGKLLGVLLQQPCQTVGLAHEPKSTTNLRPYGREWVAFGGA